MSNFFDKLKKGMEIKNPPPEELPEEKTLKPEFSTEKPVHPVRDKSLIGVEKPPVVLASAPFSSKTEVPKSKKVGQKNYKKKVETVKKVKVKTEKKESEKQKSEIKEEKKWFKPARQSFALQNLGGPEGQLTVDVYQTNEEIVIQSAIAGVEPEDLDISIENDVVTIKGNRERLFEKEKKNYFYQECYWGRFLREIILPAEVDSSKATATMKKGVLTIRIPKIDKEDKRKISVKE